MSLPRRLRRAGRHRNVTGAESDFQDLPGLPARSPKLTTAQLCADSHDLDRNPRLGPGPARVRAAGAGTARRLPLPPPRHGRSLEPHMNTISASAPPVRHRHPIKIRQAARKLGSLIAPRDHAGKGNWSKDADIPPWVGWPAGIALAAFALFGRQILGWLLHFAI